MIMEARKSPLSHCDRNDPKHADVALLTEDFAGPHLPDLYEDQGVPLCKLHSGIYQPLRGYMMCSCKGFHELGPTRPGNKYYFPKHFCGSIAPRLSLPKSSSREKYIPQLATPASP